MTCQLKMMEINFIYLGVSLIALKNGSIIAQPGKGVDSLMSLHSLSTQWAPLLRVADVLKHK